MRKLTALLAFAILMGFVFEVEAQMKRRDVKRNNLRMMTFRGKKKGFKKENRYNAVSVTLNALNYFGDLAPKPGRFSTDIGFTRPAVGVSFAHRFGPRYTLQGSFLYGSLKGEDIESADFTDSQNGVFRYQRNLSFRNRVKEFSVIAVFDLMENQATYISRATWTPYAYIGGALVHHNPQAQVPETGLNGTAFPNAGEWVNLRDLGTEGQHADLLPTDKNYGIKPYSNFQFAIPFGLGVRFRINEVMDLSAEFGLRYTFTDYLDDVSGNYVDLDVFGADELAKSLSYRGYELNPANTWTYTGRNGGTYTVIPGYGSESPTNLRGSKNDNDLYTVTTFRFSYIIGKSFNRAKFR